MVYPSVLFTALLAGTVQGVTGFGGGIITMLIFPCFFSIPLGAGITGSLGIALCASMVIRYRKEVNVRMAVLPALLYITVSTVVISYSMSVDQITIKKAFGGFLVLLSVYYLFISKSVQNRSFCRYALCGEGYRVFRFGLVPGGVNEFTGVRRTTGTKSN